MVWRGVLGRVRIVPCPMTCTIAISSRGPRGKPRRLARGARVHDVDWAHLVEEIEDAGLSELNAVRSHLELLLLHLLKLRLWPDDPSVRHWRTEIVAFQRNAARRFAPSMRGRIGLDGLYRDAVD